MKTSLSLALTATLLLSGCALTSTASSPEARLVGTYRVVSFQAVPDGEAPVDVWGKQPRGYVIITPQRFTAVLTAQERKLPAGPVPTAQDFVNSFLTQVAYTGPYRVEGDRLVVKVDASSLATWVGTEQPREFALDGKRLLLSTPHGPIPPMPGKKGKTFLVWERIE